MISIHATHAGGDGCLGGHTNEHHYFNPRHPCGWRRVWLHSCCNLSLFQSTPPMRVATDKVDRLYSYLLFQSTPPMRVATGTQSHVGWLSIFQSTPPMRVATVAESNFAVIASFQSTPPMRVATSILPWLRCRMRYFNPRHPCGWRLGVTMGTAVNGNFNPRHPCGWRPGHGCSSVPVQYFNPRHPCGWRHLFDVAFHGGCRFQSTPPMRVATQVGGITSSADVFQSTPPMRVATYGSAFCRSNNTISIHATHAGGDYTDTGSRAPG